MWLHSTRDSRSAIRLMSLTVIDEKRDKPLVCEQPEYFMVHFLPLPLIYPSSLLYRPIVAAAALAVNSSRISLFAVKFLYLRLVRSRPFLSPFSRC